MTVVKIKSEMYAQRYLCTFPCLIEQEIRNGKAGEFRCIMKPKLCKVAERFVLITKCLKPRDVFCAASRNIGMFVNSGISLEAFSRICSVSRKFQTMNSYTIFANDRHEHLRIFYMKS